MQLRGTYINVNKSQQLIDDQELLMYYASQGRIFYCLGPNTQGNNHFFSPF